MTDENELKELLQFLYKEVKEEERNLALRKNQLISNGIVGFGLFFSFITFAILYYPNISQNIGNIGAITIVGFLAFVMIILFAFFIKYIITLNKYQKVHYITSTIIEKNLYELISGEKEKEDIIKGILHLFPLMRFINKLKLHKEKRLEMWFINALKHQDEDALYCFLASKFKKS